MNPHLSPKYSPKEMILSAVRNRHMICLMIKREIQQRYRGSMLGIIWSFLTPMLMLSIYTFFFTIIFQSRWGVEQPASRFDFAFILFVGLIVHGIFAECIARAPQLIIGNVNFVKKIIFPLEILPWVIVGVAIFHSVISFIVLLAGHIILNGQIFWTAIFLPLIIMPFILIVLGCSWFFSALGVYLRDISHTTGLLISILLFISPVFYSLSMLPEKIHNIALWNPLSIIITESRKVLLFSELPNWSALGIYSLCSFLIAWLGFVLFQKTRKGFADVL